MAAWEVKIVSTFVEEGAGNDRVSIKGLLGCWQVFFGEQEGKVLWVLTFGQHIELYPSMFCALFCERYFKVNKIGLPLTFVSSSASQR